MGERIDLHFLFTNIYNLLKEILSKKYRRNTNTNANFKEIQKKLTFCKILLKVLPVQLQLETL